MKVRTMATIKSLAQNSTCGRVMARVVNGGMADLASGKLLVCRGMIIYLYIFTLALHAKYSGMKKTSMFSNVEVF